MLQCLHAHIRWENMHSGWSRKCSIGFIFSYKVVVRVIYSGVFQGRQAKPLPLAPFFQGLPSWYIFQGIPSWYFVGKCSFLVIGVRECIFLGMQKRFAQIWSCFFQITYKQQTIMLRLKHTIVNKSRCLHA